ncbi:GH92 family glycosyl hydrolase [Chitinophaga sp. MM2321]|uniref:GH92 family glycosyl hydrolase n=1 Tax=Chitinophaga sp. MM2321 TaxID=3137178 RepID=UPI0032D58EB2
MRLFFSAILFLSFLSANSQNLSSYVDPFIGTAGGGNTNPGAVLPHGLLSLSPLNTYDTLKNRGMASPYRFGEKKMSGFSHLNLSGTGCREMGTFLLMPTTGNLELVPYKYWSDYSKEEASPGYYTAQLDRYHIKAELTTTLRTGISRFTFPKGKSNILINLGLSLTNRKGANIRRVSDTEVEGFKSIGGFCGPPTIQNVYFVAKLSKKPASCGVWNDERKFQDFQREIAGDNIGAYFTFDTEENETISVQVGVSYVSIDNARENLQKEQPAVDFNRVRNDALNAWNSELSKIKVEGGTLMQKSMFYTALYHILLHPNIFSDINGEYPAMLTNEIVKADGFDRYSVFSLWDTYRNVHPFLSLVYPKKQSDMVKTMIAMYKESGWLPKWELAGMETYVMVGDPALPVITDTYLRGIRNFDVALAYKAMKHNATVPEVDNPVRPGSDNLLKYGYIPEDATNKRKIWGSVSTALEYGIADWNLAQLAKALGNDEDYKLFNNRSLYYRNYFDPKTNFIRPRLSDGSWFEPFNPSVDGNSLRSQTGFVEGNTWHYTFFVPHDIPGLIKLMGGETKFVRKLVTCFDDNYFIMSNEPDMAYPYLFNYVKGEEWRTQKYVREMISGNFNTSPAGLPGNDDCGTTSAWLLFAMMGFYPDCPGNMNFQIASPVFTKITIDLDADFYPGKNFVIESPGAEENVFIHSLSLNGKPYKKYTLNHQDIVTGGRLVFHLKKEGVGK